MAFGGLFGKRRYDRARSLSRAATARRRGRVRAAIEHYREVLEHEPLNADIHRRVAPLLVSARQPDEAWESYRVAVASMVRAGFLDHAAGVLREAAGGIRKRAVWEELSQVEAQRDRPADAHRALLDGSRRFRSRAQRADAVALLMAARRLDPVHFEANYQLARLLARSGAAPLAERVLDELAGHARGSQLRRVRRRQLWLRPSPARLWRWIQAWGPQGALSPATPRSA